MFDCIVCGHREQRRVMIWECRNAKDAIEVIDIRRSLGLPDSTSKTIEIEEYKWNDEEFCRENRSLLDSRADLKLSWQITAEYTEDCGHKIIRDVSGSGKDCPQIPGSIIKEFLETKSKESSRSIVRCILRHPLRSWALVASRVYDVTSEEFQKQVVGKYPIMTNDDLAEAWAIIDADSEGVYL